MKQIKDYLNTQALKLNPEMVQISRLATQMVCQNGIAHIDENVLKHAWLPEHWRNQELLLKQIFIGLDSQFTRYPMQSAAVFGRLPESHSLFRIAAQGLPIETELANEKTHLAARTAQSGWANIANTEHWLAQNELSGEHNRRATFQAALPICGEEGKVAGVLQLENHQEFSDEELANWIGFCLGILPVLQQITGNLPDDE